MFFVKFLSFSFTFYPLHYDFITSVILSQKADFGAQPLKIKVKANKTTDKNFFILYPPYQWYHHIIYHFQEKPLS